MTCLRNVILKMPRNPTPGSHSHFGRFQLLFGKSSAEKRVPFSSTTTRQPFSARRSAETLPPKPEPTTAKSVSKSRATAASLAPGREGEIRSLLRVDGAAKGGAAGDFFE